MSSTNNLPTSKSGYHPHSPVPSVTTGLSWAKDNTRKRAQGEAIGFIWGTGVVWANYWWRSWKWIWQEISRTEQSLVMKIEWSGVKESERSERIPDNVYWIEGNGYCVLMCMLGEAGYRAHQKLLRASDERSFTTPNTCKIEILLHSPIIWSGMCTAEDFEIFERIYRRLANEILTP